MLERERESQNDECNEEQKIKQAGWTETDNKAAESEKQESGERNREVERNRQSEIRKTERERARERERSPFTRGGRAGGEAPRRQMKIMRTFLSGKIYKIVPVLLKFKISRFFFFFSLPTLFLPPSFPFPVFSLLFQQHSLITSSNEHQDTPQLCVCVSVSVCVLGSRSLVPAPSAPQIPQSLQ